MMFYLPIHLSWTRFTVWCFRLVIPFVFLLTACDLNLPTDEVDENKLDGLDTVTCQNIQESDVRDFFELRQALTGRMPLCSEKLDLLARRQSDWLWQNPHLKNSVPPHTQIEGTAGYSGSSLAMRMKSLNITSKNFFIAETIADGDFSGGVWEAYLSSVLHRSIYLAPGLIAFGYANNSSVKVFTGAIAQSDNTGPTFFPGDNQIVGRSRLLSERPQGDLNGVGWGFPISVHFSWACSDLHVKKFVMEVEGMDLTSRIYTKRELPKLRPSDVFLITDSVLPSSKVVNVSADIDCGVRTFRRSWAFKTGL